MKKIKILGIVGSFRKESFNKQLALEVKNLLEDSVEFTLLDFQDVPFFNQDLEANAPDAVKRVRSEVKNADALWIFTPEYNQFFPGVLNNLIDWLSRPASKNEKQVLSGKIVTISGMSPGMCGTMLAQHHLISLLNYLNMKVMSNPKVAIPSAMNMIKGGKVDFKMSSGFILNQINSFIDFIEKNNKNI